MAARHATTHLAHKAIALGLALALLAASAPPHAANAAGDVITLRVTTPQFELTPNKLHVPGYATDGAPGAPQLPVYGALVTLPAEGGWELTYESIGSRVLTQTVTVPAAPVPVADLAAAGSAAAAMAIPSFAPVVDQPDPAIYQAAAFYPAAIVQSGEATRQGDHQLLAVRVFPFQVNPVTGRVRYHPDVRISIRVSGAAAEPAWLRLPDAASPSAPAAAQAGPAVRIHTVKQGMHRLTYDDLHGAGVPVGPDGVDPRTFALATDGAPAAIKLQGGDDGRFNPGDLVIFYAAPYTQRWQKHNVYWLTYGGVPGPTMARRSVSAAPSAPVVDTITQTQRVEANRQYLSSVDRPMDAEHWFDDYLVIDVAEEQLTAAVTYTFDLDDPAPAGDATLRALMVGGRDMSGQARQHALAITLNGHSVGADVWQGTSFAEHLITAAIPADWLHSGANTVTLEASHALAPSEDWYMIAPDWVEIAYPAQADAEDDRMLITALAEGANQVRVTGFSTGEVAVYDIRDPQRPVELATTQATAGSGAYTLRFWDADLPAPAYALASDAALLTPTLVQADTPSSWRTPGHSADYLAIIPSTVEHGQLATDIAQAIQPLLEHRAAEGLRVAKVSVQDIYDEFSHGKRTPVAIQDFVRYAYQNWNGRSGTPSNAPPQYVLLVGDGHYDFTGITTPASPNLIPPFLPVNDYWYGEIPADNRFVSLDGPQDYLPELAIGRIPANNAAGVTRVVNKILAYENPAATPRGAWQQRAVFVAGRCDDSAGNFHALSNQNRASLPAGYEDHAVYTGDASVCPEADAPSQSAAALAAVQDEFNQGALYLQYLGHGSEKAWIDPVYYGQYTDNLQANTRLPIVAHNACSTGYFIHPRPGAQAVAEDLVVRHADRGAIANWSGSGLYTALAGMTRSQGLMQAIFHDRIDRVGLAVKAALYSYYSITTRERAIIDSTMLFGDPALKLRLPTATGSSASIGGKAWHDSNGNGVQDEPASSGLNGVIVMLLTAQGTVVDSAVTANDPNGQPGRYAFDDVAPGSYVLRFARPSGYASSPQDQGGNDAADSDANPDSGQTTELVAAASQSLAGWDAGFYKPVTVGGAAWVDADDDRRYDPDVEWLLDGLMIQVADERGQIVGAATVGPDGGFAPGQYWVGGLLPGVYTAQVLEPPPRYLPIDATRRTSSRLASGQSDLTLDFRFVATTTVTIATLTAQQRGAVVTLNWQTLAEEGITGFHVWRATAIDGPYQRLTMTPLPSQAVGGGGGSYRWEDDTVLPGQAYWYKLSTVPDGAQVGPVAAERIRGHVFLPAVERSR
jgi:hypothetical protein